ncbi:MAG TPA: multiheme c-type cytochrome, partial [Vicinamibacterales bacterium]|nr:multiheme c-type cytochrome [Vicinamibacterales bacterium]
FAHNTIYPLAGAHATQACTACHKNNVYKGTPRDCFGCHRTNYERTTSPNHAAAGFPTACESCHRPSDASWKTTFNHSSAYPLAGVHATQPCSACHKNNVYKGTPRDCVGCHRTNYERTTSPNHASAGFPTACESCHRASDASWRATFNHNSVFALVGVHATQACTACHTNNVYKGTPRDCFSCHRTDYERTASPNHAAAGFPTACDSCHSASSSTWSASFDHNRFFVLAGRHLSAACSSCHRSSVYRGTPRECYPCHASQYDRATNPNHRAAGFPTTCETCHRNTDSSFNQGRFNHTWFPITSGKHAGRACAECHLDSNNFKVFTCTTCHTRTKMDSEHAGRAGYRYDSAACYSCHPTGQG